MHGLSSTLRKLLTIARLSEAELARRVKLPQPMVNRLATGKNPNPKLQTLKPITDYFSITFSQLLGEDPLPTNIEVSLNKHVKEAAIASWQQILDGTIPSTGIELVPTLNEVSSDAFALNVSNTPLTTNYAQDTLLIVDPKKSPALYDLVLIRNNGSLSLHKLENHNQHLLLQQDIVGVLIETKAPHR